LGLFGFGHFELAFRLFKSSYLLVGRRKITIMNPFQNIRNWTRKDFDESDEEKKARRERARVETDHDLQKPVQQLLCDVHEESLAPVPTTSEGAAIVFQLQRLIGAQKRMVSLQTVSTFQTGRTNALVFWLTAIIVIQTFVLIYLTLYPRTGPSPVCHCHVDGADKKSADKK
jgi:hypothetical protein